jgi:hypothetical protein
MDPGAYILFLDHGERKLALGRHKHEICQHLGRTCIVWRIDLPLAYFRPGVALFLFSLLPVPDRLLNRGDIEQPSLRDLRTSYPPHVRLVADGTAHPPIRIPPGTTSLLRHIIAERIQPNRHEKLVTVPGVKLHMQPLV